MKNAVLTAILVIGGIVAFIQVGPCDGITKVPAKIGQTLSNIEQEQERRKVEEGKAETLRQMNDPEYRAAKIKEIEKQEAERKESQKSE